MDKQIEKEVKPVPVPPAPPEKPKTRDERKAELQAKMQREHGRLPQAEAKELFEITQAEELERKRGALIHKLCEKVDRYGRKEAGKVRREVTDKVAGFNTEKLAEQAGVEDSYTESYRAQDKATKKAMQNLQEEHNKAVAELRTKRDVQVRELVQKYAGRFSEAEQELENRLLELDAMVVDFTSSIQALSLEELEELFKGGTVKVKGGEDYLVVPGQDP
jgi:hypothetical protein